ncbi:GntR family transcriptional regulator [Nonomuraea sp. NPDC046802]|uniref:GntR family transcriptional regulator n=1 Tax=Nonomuraea sp. NPDC046802 TaxID=3154919 RepID=UPI0033DCF076
MSTGAGTMSRTDARNPAAAIALSARRWGEDLVANAGRGDMAKRIAADLRERIHREMRPGDQVPSEEAIAEQYGVSRTPARTALLALKTEGLLEARPQAGYIVRLWDPQPINATLTAGGGREFGAAVSVSTVVPSGRVAQLMPEDDDVVCRRVVAGAVTSSYYSRRVVAVVPELGRAALLEENDVVLLGRAGLTVTRSRVQVRAYPPTPEQQELLGVSPETPVLEHVAALRDGEGHTLLVRVWLLAGDRNFLELEGEV